MSGLLQDYLDRLHVAGNAEQLSQALSMSDIDLPRQSLCGDRWDIGNLGVGGEGSYRECQTQARRHQAVRSHSNPCRCG